MMAGDGQREDLLTRLLVQLEEQLAAGTHPGDLDTSAIADDAELAAEWEADRHCLELLDRVRRQWSPEDVGETHAGRQSAATSVEDGRKLGRFRILGELGSGGLGVVHLAYDPRLGRQVALKVPRAESLLSADLRRRFLREAEAAARLNHPHLVTVYDSGEDAGLCYIASEFCPGPTLSAWLKQRTAPVPIRAAALVVKQLAEAVGHAHGRGVLHRDIKPSNVLLERRGTPPAAAEARLDGMASLEPEQLCPKLTDFGMAKLLEREGDETRSGALVGTPAYMAPEQARGQVRELDARTDVYALGAILYEMLTGRRVFETTSDVEALRKVLFDEPTRPRRLRPAIPRDLEAIALRCLAKSSDARYATAQQLVDDLDRFLTGKPTEARPLSSVARVGKWARRHPALAALAAVASASAAALFAVVLGYNARLSSAVVRAEREAETSRRLLYVADVRLAHEAYRAGNVEQVRELLARHVPHAGQEDLRGFAWRYLDGLLHREALALVGHKDEVFSVAYSPDGRQLATASKDRTARLWDAAAGRQTHLLEGHSGEVTRVAFSPDGSVLASASEDGTIRLWDAASGAARGVLEGHSDHVLTVAFAPDSKSLASGGRDQSVRVWDVTKGECQRVLEEPRGVVTTVAFSPDGTLLVAGDDVGGVHCYDTRDWRQLPGASSPAPSEIWSLAFSRDLPWLAGAGKGAENAIRIWRWSDQGLAQVSAFPHGHLDRVQALAFSPLDNTLASCDRRGAIKIWSLGATESAVPLAGHTDRVWSLAFSPDGRRLASAGADRVVKIWDTAHFAEPASLFPASTSAILAADVTPDAKTLLTASSDGRVLVWDLPQRRLLTSRSVHDGAIGELVLSPDGRRVAIGRMASNRVVIASLDALARQQSIPTQVGHQAAVAWSPDGRRLALANTPYDVTIVDSTSSAILHQFRVEHTIHHVAYSPDGQLLATISDRLRLHDAQSGAVKFTLDEADRARFSPDGRLVAAARLAAVAIYEVSTGKRLRLLSGQAGELRSLSFSPRGTTLLTLTKSSRPTIALWDVGTGQELLQLPAPAPATLFDVRFMADEGRLVGVGSQVEAGRIWEWTFPTAPRPPAPHASPPAVARLPAENATLFQKRSELLLTFAAQPTAHARLAPFRVRVVAHDAQDVLPASAMLHPVAAFGDAQAAGAFADPRWLAVADFDSDGDLDIGAASRAEKALHFLLNQDGGRTFEERGRWGLALAEAQANDFDGDGRPELVLALEDGIRTFYIRDNRIRVRQISDLPAVDELASGDFDGDGDIDLACGSTRVGSLWTVTNLGENQFSAPEPLDRMTAEVMCLAAADLDADGDLDLASACGPRLAWYANDGHGVFSPPQMIAGDVQIESLIAADVSGDSLPDLLGVGGERVTLAANQGRGRFAPPQAVASNLSDACDVDAADLDGDGDLDLLVCEDRAGRVSSFRNDGGGNFYHGRRPIDGRVNGSARLCLGDLNQDGRVDVVVGARRQDRVVWYANQGLRLEVVPEHSAASNERPVPCAPHALQVIRRLEPSVAPPTAMRSVTLAFEDASGRPLASDELAAVLADVRVYRDRNGNGAVDPQVDSLAAVASNLALDEGRLTIPLDASQPADERPEAPSVASAQWFRAVNAWAIDHGYAGGYPTFADGPDGAAVCQAVVLKAPYARLALVPGELMLGAMGAPPCDFATAQDQIVDVTRRMNRWAWAKGYGGALFTSRIASPGMGPAAHEVLLVNLPDPVELHWTADELGQPDCVEAVFRAAHLLAREHGHVGSFPSFVRSGTALRCVTLDAPAAELRDIPIDELRFSGAP